ncbi:ATP-binding protein [Actinoplanes sp. CA-015351]|uniref:ATP-binding protein n=1 Tax=Actinoplanes sp. CA-015351 TaxID=3239897 RepID=UPI003D98DD5A
MTDSRQLEIIAWSEEDRSRLYGADRGQTIAEALRGGTYLLPQPFNRLLADLRVGDVDLVVRTPAEIDLDTPLYRAVPAPRGPEQPGVPAPASHYPEPPPREAAPAFPEQITVRNAVGLAYAEEIETIASFLRQDLSVLVSCEKLVVEQLGPLIAERAGRQAVVLDTPGEEADPTLMMPRPQRQRQLARLRELLAELKDGMFLIVPHADLLAGGPDNQLNAETREVVELLYNHSEGLLLAFADPSIGLPEVLASRFTARIGLAGSPRAVPDPLDGRPRLLGELLVTRQEADLFQDYDPSEFHKHVAGLNAIRVRQAMQYAYHQHRGRENPTGLDLFKTIRGFKAQLSASFEVPNVSFNDIGGYDDVKREIADALKIMQGGADPESAAEELLQSDLIPRGFIFHGPPGTGKTLFAKAIANQLNATIMVVSGPEVTDKYVGEGERKIRELFAEARRNAPSVIVFDEFDAIAGRRSDRDDGGSRAGNAMVAQLLTELDGFREQVPFLVVGTTNQLNLIDPALLRPSRFRGIRIGPPDPIARRGIIEVHAKRFKIDLPPQLVDLMVDATDTRSGDHIQSLLRDAYVAQKLHGRQSNDPFLIGELVGKMNRAFKEQRESHL